MEAAGVRVERLELKEDRMGLDIRKTGLMRLIIF